MVNLPAFNIWSTWKNPAWRNWILFKYKLSTTETNQKILLKTYRALIRSNVDYSSTIYNSTNLHMIQIIELIRNTGQRIATDAYCACPVSDILCETNATGLKIKKKVLKRKYALKIVSISNNTTISYQYHIFSNR